MTISTTDSRVSYDGNDSTVTFAIPFYFLENTHLQVVLSDVDGVESVQSVYDYTVSGAGDPDGGELSMDTAPATGEKLTINRNVPLTQEVEYPENDVFPASSHETALDKLTMAAQQLEEQWNRALRVPISSEASVEMPTPTASCFLAWNDSATRLQNVPASTIADIVEYGMSTIGREIVLASDYATLALADAAAVAAGKQLVIHTQWNTVPATISSDVRMVRGGKLNNSSSVTFSGSFEADATTHFIGAGAVILPVIPDPVWFGADRTGVSDSSSAFQAAVDSAIASGTFCIKTNFSGKAIYRLASTVDIVSSGFALLGNCPPTYRPEENGYIFGDPSLTTLFDYGAGTGTSATNHFIADGMSFYDPGLTLSQTAIAFTQNNNGPHRGVTIRNCSGRGFENIALFAAPTVGHISAATVVVESCVFHDNINTVSATSKVFGLRYVGNQSEQGAKISGMFDAGITIIDNNLEGQANPINIDSPSPKVVIENNYFEAITGDYVARVNGANTLSVINIKQNFFDNIDSTDVYLIEGVNRVYENYIESLQNSDARKSMITLKDALLLVDSDISGKFYTPTTGTGARGTVRPHRLAGILPASAVVSKALGSDSFSTPFGPTTTGKIINGYPATFFQITKSWAIGDVAVAVALVKADAGTDPYFNVTCNGNATGLTLDLFSAIREGEWVLMFYAKPMTMTNAVSAWVNDFRFGSNGTGAGGTGSIYVAAIGVDVIPAADFETFNGNARAAVTLFNPF